jgi:CRP-like cAMP-binding protein
MYEEWTDLLQRTRIFQDISAAEMEAMLACLQPKVIPYRKEAAIALAGDKFTCIGIILSGTAAVTKENAAGNRVIIAIIGPGELFGEVAAFGGGGVWPATVYAQEECTVLFLPPDMIIGECPKICASHRKMIANTLRLVSEKALRLNQKLEYLALKSIRGKISLYLLEQYNKKGSATFMLPMKRNELADFFNVTRPSLSREMGQMREEGLIDFHMASVKLKDIEALKMITEAG